MFIFHRIGWENDSEHSGWWLYIDTFEQLLGYLKYSAHEMAQVWIDIKNSPEDKSGHCRTRKASIMKEILAIKTEQEGRTKIPMIEAVNFIEQEFTGLKVKILEDEGAVYISSGGGCHGPHLRNDHKGVDEHIYDVHENKDLIFPSMTKDIVTITQWPMSPHFYLSVNGRHTDVDGVEKWNTIEAAEEAKEICLKRLKKKKSKKEQIEEALSKKEK